MVGRVNNNLTVIIAGGRDFNDFSTLQTFCDKILSNRQGVTVVSGTANGADRLGEIYANKKGYEIIRMPADWNAYGKSAGYKRNENMASIADALIAFWDGESRGTKHMIDIARRKGLKIRVKRY